MLTRDKPGTSIAAALAAAALLGAGCGSTSEPIVGEGATSGPANIEETTQPAGAQEVVSATAEAVASEPQTLALDHPDEAFPLVWVRRGARVDIRSEPNGGRVVDVVDKRTEFSSPTVFSVIKESGEWAGVATPFLPNGTLGWIRLDPDKLKAGWTTLAIQVDLSQRRAALHEAGKVVRTFPVTVGEPGYDTPTGRFAVTDTFRGDLDPGSYGCCALALTATQPTVPSGWLGGNRIAIHGTSGPLGVAASHGCVRAADADVDGLVDRVPLGAPVFIRA